MDVLFNQATAGLTECGLDGRLVRANDYFCAMLGRSRDELLGRHLREIVHPDDLPRSEELLAGRLAEDRFETEKRYLRPDGSEVWTRTAASLIRNAAGEPERGVAVSVDITRDRQREAALRESEAALRESQERFRLIANAAPGIIWAANAAGGMTYANERWFAYTGRAPGEGLGHGWLETIHPDDRPLAQRTWQEVRTTGIPYEAELRYRRSDGEYRWHLVRANPHRDPATGQVVAWYGHATDIHANKMTEASLRESEQRLQATYEHAATGIAEFDQTGRFLRVNGCMCTITGYDEAELLARTCHAITHPDDRAADLEQFNRLMAGEIESYALELRYIRKDGGLVWVAASATRVDDEFGRPLYGIRVMRDISERKQAEEKRRLLVNELNHRVKNTLATVQSIVSQTLRSAGSPPRVTDDIVSRLLALSRMHDVLTQENWEGASLADTVSQAIAPYAGRGDGRFEVHGPDVRLTPQQVLAVAMALQELATNAVKYGALSNDTGRVEIGWTVEGTPEGQRLRLVWQESGGPPVAPPTRRGFGTRLIERSLARELEGIVRIEFAPSGVTCRADVPLSGGAA